MNINTKRFILGIGRLVHWQRRVEYGIIFRFTPSGDEENGSFFHFHMSWTHKKNH